MSTGCIFLSRHVIFDDKCFPFKETTPTTAAPSSTDSPIRDIDPSPLSLQPYPTPNPSPHSNPTHLHTPKTTPHVPSQQTPPQPSSFSINSPTPTSTKPLTQTQTPTPYPTPAVAPILEILPVNVSLPTISTGHQMTTQAKDGIRKPNPKYTFHIVLANDIIEPTCFSQANKYPEWRIAMADEFNALQRTGTWTLVPVQPSMNVLPNKWVYCIKRKFDGSIERYKARLVANGFHQQEGIDCRETFSPVVTHATIRMILSIALHYQWPIRQLDVQNAFLHGAVTEEVHMRRPSGFVDPQFPSHVCRLRKSLYGLKQAHRAWFQCFSHHLEDLGFIASVADASLFTFFNEETVVYLLIYVDDILISGNNTSQILSLIAQLGTKFSMKDLGHLSYFLGMEIKCNSQAMYLSQSKYILDLLKKTNMADAKPLTTPAAPGRKLSLYEGEPLSDGTTFRSVVGALQYLLFTRPEIAFAVNQVCQYMHSPTTSHWALVKRILRYLKGNHDYALVYTPSSLALTAFADADYAGDPDDRQSTCGYCIFLGNNLISWSSKKQRGVSRSSCLKWYQA